MPSKTERQHNAMEAAAHGHSTLGIPKDVGQDFVAADAGKKKAEGGVVEHEDHFRVSGPHGEYRIAKHGLHPATVKMIQKMATGGEVRHYAEGDLVRPDPSKVETPNEVIDYSQTGLNPSQAKDYVSTYGEQPPGTERTEKLKPSMGEVKAQEEVDARKAKGEPGFLERTYGGSDPETEAQRRVDQLKGNTGGLLGADRQGNPDVNSREAPRATAKLADVPEKEGPGASQNPGLNLEMPSAPRISDVTEPEKAAVAAAEVARDANASAHEAGASEKSKIREKLIADDAAALAHRDEQVAAINTQQEALRKDIREGKIDPNKYWNDKGAAGKVLGGIGILLSGLGSGMSAAGGHPVANMAMEVIQRGIDREIDAQKANLHTKESLLADTYRQTGDINYSTMVARSHLQNVALAQLQSVADKTDSADTKMKAELATQQGRLLLGQSAREIVDRRSALNTEAANAGKNIRNQVALAQAGGAGGKGDPAALKAIQARTLLNMQGVREIFEAADSVGDLARGPVGKLKSAVTPGDVTNQQRQIDKAAYSQSYAKMLHGGPSETAAREFEKIWPGKLSLKSSQLAFAQMLRMKAARRGQQLNQDYVNQGFKPPFPELGLPGAPIPTGPIASLQSVPAGEKPKE